MTETKSPRGRRKDGYISEILNLLRMLELKIDLKASRLDIFKLYKR